MNISRYCWRKFVVIFSFRNDWNTKKRIRRRNFLQRPKSPNVFLTGSIFSDTLTHSLTFYPSLSFSLSYTLTDHRRRQSRNSRASSTTCITCSARRLYNTHGITAASYWKSNDVVSIYIVRPVFFSYRENTIDIFSVIRKTVVPLLLPRVDELPPRESINYM